MLARKWDGEFESGFLQQGVRCEPDIGAAHDDWPGNRQRRRLSVFGVVSVTAGGDMVAALVSAGVPPLQFPLSRFGAAPQSSIKPYRTVPSQSNA
jgi:hypothetical protein